MREYICAVTSAALVVSVLAALTGRGTVGALVRLAGGLFMALTVLSPLLELELPSPEDWINGFEIQGRAAAEAGARQADAAERAIIKERTEAYIVDKAAGFDAVLDVEVVLDQQGIPAEVILSGKVPADAKAKLKKVIAAELGLGEEVQQWTGGS